MTTALVIPVPDGYTPEDALMEIQVFGHLWERRVEEDGTGGRWAVIVFEDDDASPW